MWQKVEVVMGCNSLNIRLIAIYVLLFAIVGFSSETTNGLFFAEGILVEQGDSWARFSIRETYNGEPDTDNVVYVTFFRNSVQDSGIPQNAYLILQYYATNISFGTVYQAFGGDAYRGILAKTEENRSRFESLVNDPDLDKSKISTTREISKTDAISIVFQHLSEVGIEISHTNEVTIVCKRYEVGWVVRVVNLYSSNCFVNDFFRVGDDGILKDPRQEKVSKKRHQNTNLEPTPSGEIIKDKRCQSTRLK